MAVVGVGGRVFNLAPLTSQDLALAYNVEAQFASQFPSAAPSKANDKFIMTLGGVDFVAASASGFAIDGDALHNDALLIINIDPSTNIYARGARGGDGGPGRWNVEIGFDQSGGGDAGSNGGTAIRFGCETNIKGSAGLITKGYAGGGGGGGGATGPSNIGGGGGAGGGAALGAGGTGGIEVGPGTNDGANGTAATRTANGVGGAGGSPGGNGGNGGDAGGAATNGAAGTSSGGLAGSDGNAIDSQGFTHSIDGGITVTGAII
jgi:hypothetical protein